MRSPLLAAGALALSLWTSGCHDDQQLEAPAPVEDCGTGERRSFLISTLGFTRIDKETGTVPGFNIDGVVSDKTDDTSCFKPDFKSPDGEPGIDNQLAALIPDVEAILGDAVDGLVQSAINNGALLILIDVDGAQDLRNDDCVDITVRTVTGNPVLGTDGVIEAYQTFDPDPEALISHGAGGKIDNGMLTIGPFELAIPIAIFDVAFTINVHGALLRLQVSAEDGVLKSGILGGGVVPQQIVDGVAPGAGVDQYLPVISLALNGSTDLAQDADGKCQHVSAGLAITAVEAFVRE
jgi:hypothetical protein